MRKVLELPDGYLIGGYKQKQNFLLDIFVMKTDKIGEKVWEKSYGNPSENDVLGSLIMVDENTFVIGGNRGSSYDLPLSQRWARSRIIAIDSMGLVKWDWQSEQEAETGIVGLNPDGDGGWIYCSNERDVNTEEDWFDNRPKIVRRDSNMELLWESVVTVGEIPLNTFTDMKPTPDGNWVGAGYWVLPFNDVDVDARQGGGLHMVTPQGDLCWTRNDSSYWNLGGQFALDYFAGLTVLPSGSIVAAGRTDRQLPGPGQSFGWVVKVSPDGNLDMLCTVSASGEVASEKENPRLQVWPNPARSQVNFLVDGSTTFDKGNLVFFNSFGQEVLQMPWDGSPSQLIDTSGLPSGIYHYRFTTEKGQLASGSFTVLH